MDLLLIRRLYGSIKVFTGSVLRPLCLSFLQIKKEANRLCAYFDGRLARFTVDRLFRFTKTLHALTIAESDKEKDAAGQSDIIKQAKRLPVSIERQIIY